MMMNTIIPTLLPVSYQTVTPLSPKPLPKFTPGPFDVICARGKQAYNHDGVSILFYSILFVTIDR